MTSLNFQIKTSQNTEKILSIYKLYYISIKNLPKLKEYSGQGMSKGINPEH